MKMPSQGVRRDKVPCARARACARPEKFKIHEGPGLLLLGAIKSFQTAKSRIVGLAPPPLSGRQQVLEGEESMRPGVGYIIAIPR